MVKHTGLVLRLVPSGIGGHVLRLSVLMASTTASAATKHLFEELELSLREACEEEREEGREVHLFGVFVVRRSYWLSHCIEV